MHPSEIMLTNMNEFFTQEATNLFPIVMASTTSTYMSYIGIGLVAIGLFPEMCWLTTFFGYTIGGSVILFYVLS